MGILGACRLSTRLKGARLLSEVFVGGGSRKCLNTAQARADAAFAGDHKASDLAGGATVGAATELVRVLLHAHGAHSFAVLLIEEGVGASLDRLSHAHVCDNDGHIFSNRTTHLGLGLIALIARK